MRWKKEISDFTYAFRLAWNYAGGNVLQRIIFSTVSTAASFFFDVYYIAYILKLLTQGADWPQVRTACVAGVIFVLIRVVTGKYAEFQLAAYSKNITEKGKRALYEKSLGFPLDECLNDKYYNEYAFVIHHGPENINFSVSILEKCISALLYCCFFVADMLFGFPELFFLMLGLVVLQRAALWFFEKRLSDIRYENDTGLAPYARKRDYFERLFYLKNYAYDLKDRNTFDFVIKSYDETMVKYEKQKLMGERRELWPSLARELFRNMFGTLAIPLLLVCFLQMQGVHDLTVYWVSNAMFLTLSELYLFRLPSDLYSLSKYVTQMRGFMERKIPVPANDLKEDAAPSIEIEALSFHYPGNTSFALKNISLTIKSGEKIAIVGKNGSGKTTLLNLVLGLYKPDSGGISINGHRKKGTTFQENAFSLMAQEFNLYSTSLRNNITMGDDTYSQEQINKAVKAAKCDELIGELPKEWNTVLGHDLYEDAVELSGGQAQRIALARTVLNGGKFVIMDEPTAAIDPTFEREIIDGLMESVDEKTVMIITHRLDITRNVDKIYVMDNGEVVESGTFEELTGRKTLFRDMYQFQIGG